MVTATSIWSSEVCTRGAWAEAGDGVGDAFTELLLGGVGVTGVDRLGVVEHEVHHQLRAERLDELGGATQAAVGRRIGGDGGVLEVLRADPDDHPLTAVAGRGSGTSPTPRGRTPTVWLPTVTVPPPSSTVTLPSYRFIDGDPMNAATNTLVGLS